jgi:poly-gamma-glutamate synthesis protein (capsule biosynthesis protein)
MSRYGILGGLFAIGFLVTFGFLSSQSRVTTVAALPLAFAEAQESHAKLLFVGDMMFDRTIRKDLNKNGVDGIFGRVASLLMQVDFVAGNLEGPITTNKSLSSGTGPGDENNTRFTFDPRVAGILADYRFKLVAIGNNHIADFGRAGVASTTEYLANVGIAAVGNPFSTSTEPVIETVNEIKIGFVGYDAFIRPNADQARAAIRRARKEGADFVVVMAHWGVEYDPTPPQSAHTLAKSFSEAGADLIIGTHPHVIGDIEDIGNTRVYYSLGNFIFDQYWDESVSCGLTVAVTLTKINDHTSATYETQNVHLERGGSTTVGCG